MIGAEVRPHLQAIAHVLEGISLEVEALGTTLCGDPDFVLRHVEKLQQIDLMGQKQRSLAALLRADCPKAAMDEICLDDLRMQLSDLLHVGGWQQI